MSRDDQAIIQIACAVLDDEELQVWLSKHVAGKGRRSGSLSLGITEEAWRYRLQRAHHKIIHHIETEAA